MNEKPKKPESSTHVLQIRKIGNSTGVILPKELLLKLGLKEGDKLSVVEQPEKKVQLSAYDADFTEAMEVAKKGMKRYRNALAELAK